MKRARITVYKHELSAIGMVIDCHFSVQNVALGPLPTNRVTICMMRTVMIIYKHLVSYLTVNAV
jgi:sRNA-binding regulator protein Hfq